MTLATAKLRPRSLPELLDVGVGLYRDHFLHFLGVAAVVNLPLGLLGAVLTSAVFSGQAPGLARVLVEGDRLSSGAVFAGVVGVAALWLLGALAGTFALAALLSSLQARLEGERPGVLSAYRRSLRRVPALLGARLLYYLGTFGGLLPGAAVIGGGGYLLATAEGGAQAAGGVLLAVGVGLLGLGLGLLAWLWVRWRFHAQASVIEGAGPVRSLRRSTIIVAGNWWRTLFFLVLKWLLITALSSTPNALVGVPLAIFAGTAGEPGFWPQLVANAVSTLAGILLLPAEVIAITMLYYDYRVRREALDIEAGLSALEREGVRA